VLASPAWQGSGERSGILLFLAALRMLTWDTGNEHLSSFWLSPNQAKSMFKSAWQKLLLQDHRKKG